MTVVVGPAVDVCDPVVPILVVDGAPLVAFVVGARDVLAITVVGNSG